MPRMTLGNVVFYDFEHCREFLEDHAKHLRDTATGLNVLGLYRELFHGFTHEAPIVFERLSAQESEPDLAMQHRRDRWMRAQLKVLVDEGVIGIHKYFNGQHF